MRIFLKKKNIELKRFYYKLQFLYSRNKVDYYKFHFNYLKVEVTFAPIFLKQL